jgi:RNA polymerase-binding transcription factor DksA
LNAEEMLLQAEQRVEAERNRSIAAACEAVSAMGAEACVDCGTTIPAERRLAAPWARRCIECQEFYEAERLSK